MATTVQTQTVTLVRSDKANATGAGAGSNADAERQARRGRALLVIDAITDRWKQPTHGLFDLQHPMDAAKHSPEAFRVLAYELLAQTAQHKMKAGAAAPSSAREAENVATALGGEPDREPYLKALALAHQTLSRDIVQFDTLGDTLENLIHGGEVRWNTKDLLVHYAQLSNDGKKWVAKAPKTLAFKNYVNGAVCLEHGALEATHVVAAKRTDPTVMMNATAGGGQRVRECLTLVSLFERGALGAEATKESENKKPDDKKPDGAVVGADGKVEPDPIETAANALIARIKDEIKKHSTAKHDEHTLHKASLKKLITEIEAADDKVKDRVYGKPELMEQLMQLDPGQMKQLVAKLDSVQGLYETLEQWAPQAHAPKTQYDPNAQARIPLDKKVYPTIATFLSTRPGKDMAAARMRVLQHEQLKARFIDNLAEAERKDIYKLVASGTLEPTLVDKVRDGARKGSVPETARALMKLGSEAPHEFGPLQQDQIFRKEIENVDKEESVDGFMVNAYHLCLTFWGIEPLSTKDASIDERQQEANTQVGPDGKAIYRPLTIEERMELESNLLDPYATKLRSEIHEDIVDDDDMRDICRSFERASKDYLTHFRTLGKAPGPMLTEFYNKKYRGHDLRGEVDEYVSGQELVECNRILGYSVDSATLGTIAGKIVEHGGKKPTDGKVGLAQALRETYDDKGVPLSQRTADYAQQLCNWMYEIQGYQPMLGMPGAASNIPSVNKDELLASWHKYRDLINGKAKDIAAITTLDARHIHPIELLSNAVREKGGELAGKIKRFYGEKYGGAIKDQSADILRDMGLRAEDEAERAKAANAELAAADPQKGIEKQAKDKWSQPAAKLFESIAKLPASLETSEVEPVAALFQKLETDKFEGAVVAGPSTKSIEERPPKTFIGYYRLEYGIDPRLHISRVLKAHKDHGKDITAAAARFGVAVADAIAVPSGDELKITDSNRVLVRHNFTEDTARTVARQLWNSIHEGTRLNAVITKFYTDFSDEEQRLIRMGFRELSGGIDLQFYLQQKLLEKKSSDAFGQTGVTAIGAEGTELTKGAGFTKSTELNISGDANELQVAVTAVKEGTVDTYAMMKSAADKANVDGIMRLADEAEQEDRAKILQDHELMDRIRKVCDAVAWNRVYKTLTNQADLVDRLYQRGAGLGTDEKGMREDIKAHVKRLQKKFTKDLRAQEAAKPKQAQRGPEDIESAAKQMVREECQRLMANISVRRIIEEELSADELSEMESLVLNAGETNTQSDVLRAGKEADEIIAGIRNTEPAKRAQLRGDAAYLEKLAERLRAPDDYRKAMDALMSDRPGEDVLSKIDGNATKDKSRTMLRDLVDLSPAELKKLQADPDMQAKLLATFEDPEKRALARKILTAKLPELSPELKSGDNTDKAAEQQEHAERQRIAFLRQNAINRLLVPTIDKLGWPTMLEQCIEVYKMELEHRAVVKGEGEGARSTLMSFSDKESQADRTQRENTAGVMRKQIWHQVEKEVAVWAFATEKDKPRRTLSKVWTANEMIDVVRDAVLKKRDPSAERILENLGATVEIPDTSGMPGSTRKHELDNDYDGIKTAIRSASDQLLVEEWSNVKQQPLRQGEGTLADVYAQYKQANEAAKPKGELEPTVEARHRAEDKKLAFMNYTLDVSTTFEELVLPHVGPSDERKLSKDGGTGPVKERDNKKYNELLDVARERIVKLTKGDAKFLVAKAIHIDPASEDFKLIDQQNRDSVTAFAYRDSKYLRSRGTQAGSGWAADSEAKFLDQRMMQYGHDMAASQTNAGDVRGIITQEEGARLEERGVELERALTAFKEAKAKVAFWMSMIIGALVTAVLTVLTGGLATGPLMALFFTTAIAGVSAGAKALINEAVLAEDYDLKDEGVKMIGKEMLTAFVTAGTTMMAQKFVSSVSGVTKAARQARVLEQVGNNPPPIWRSFLSQGSEEIVSEGMSGVIDAGIAAVDPVHWMHGMAEGRDRAIPQMWEQLSNVPMNALKGGVTSMLTAGVMRFGKKKELQAVAQQAGKHGKVDIRENFKKVFGGNSERMIAVFVEWTMNNAGKQKIDLDKVPGDLLEGFLQEVGETSVETHTGTAHEAKRSGRTQKDLDKYKDKISKHESDAFVDMQSRATSTDPYVTVGEFVRARQQMTRDAIYDWAERNPGKTLTQEQVKAFDKWVRDAPDAKTFHERLATDPLTVREVNDAKTVKPAAGTQTDAQHAKDGAAKQPPVVEVQPVGSVEEGYALMRRLAGGDKTAVTGEHGETDHIEWGLGRKSDGTIVILKGKQGEVDFDHIPGIVALAHSHPAVMDGKPRDLGLATKQPGGVAISDLMDDKNSNDLIKFLPSTGDLGYFADNTIAQHVVFTPYVHMGDGKVGNPNTAVPPGQRIEIVVNNAHLAGRSAIQKHQPAYSATIIIRTGDGQVLWTGPMFAVKIAGGSFRADQPSLAPNMIEQGVMPDPKPSDDEAKIATGEGSEADVIAKYGTRKGDKKVAAGDKHAKQGNQVSDDAPGSVQKPRTATDVFAGVTPVHGEVWTFKSASGNFYTGRFQGVDATGHIVVETGDVTGRLDPMRLASGRRGPSTPQLHEFGPHDRVRLLSVNNNARTGTIQGYDDAGNVIFKADSGEIQIIPPVNLKLDQTKRAPHHDQQAQQQQQHKPTEQEQAAQQQASQQQAQQLPQYAPQQAVARTADDVFAGQRPMLGQLWTFESVSGNFYQGRFQGIDDQGRILVNTHQGVASLEPQRLVNARIGASVQALQAFGPTDRITLYSSSGTARTGVILGYDEQGNVHFQTERGIEILPPHALDLTRTHREQTQAPQTKPAQDPSKPVQPQQQQQAQPQHPQQQSQTADAAQQVATNQQTPIEGQRDIQRDLPTLGRLGTMDAHVIGAHQASRVPAAVRALSETDYQQFRALHDSLQSPVAQAFLLKALAAHNSMGDMQWLASEMAFKDDAWLMDALTLGDPRAVGVGVQQQWSMSCNASTTVTLRGNYDPIFALKLRYSNPNISKADPNDPMTFNQHLAQLEAQMLHSGYQGPSHPHLWGASGVAAPHAVGATKGRWADDILSRQQDVTGMTYGTHKNPTPAMAFKTIDAAVRKGMQVPIVIGNAADAHTHYVLVMSHRNGPNGPEYSVHNTGDGTTTWVTAEQILNRSLPLNGGNMITAIEVPTATTHPDQSQQQVVVDPTNPQKQQGQTAGAGAKTQPMAAVTVEDAPAIASTAVAVVSQQLPESSLAARLQPSGEQAPAPKGEQAKLEAAAVPQPVANAVQLIVHGRAINAAQQLQAMEAKAAAATAQQQSGSQQQQQTPGTEQDASTQSWKAGPADLKQFKEFFDVGYEDAIDKVQRAMGDPTVAALLSRVPIDELAAIVLYTQTYYTEMNDALRKRDQEGMKDFGNAIKLADKGLSKLPVHEGWVHRGVDSLPDEVLAKYVPGVVVTEDAFTSSSQIETGAFKGKVKFNIMSKSGRDVRQLSRVEAEKEVLFRPGTKFIVVDKVRDGDATVITMEEVDAGPKNAPGGPGGTSSGVHALVPPDVHPHLAKATPLELGDLARLAGTNATKLTEVLRTYGDDVVEYLRFNPATTVDELAAALKSQAKQVRTHVDNLYPSIAATSGAPAAGWAVDTNRVTHDKWESTIQDPSGKELNISRKWDASSGTLTMDTAFGSPDIQKVPTSPALIASSGTTPAMAYVNLQQMRAMGIPYGKGATSSPLHTVKMSTIQNFETIGHLQWLRERYPAANLDELIVHTASYRYAADIMTQAGYRVTGVRIDMSPGTFPMQGLLKHYETDRMSKLLFQQSGAERAKVHDKMLGRYGIDAQSVRDGLSGDNVDTNFNIFLEVEPLP